MHSKNAGVLPQREVLRQAACLKEPFISVVTVSLNAKDFIEHNLQSVAAQTYPHREHIVIDGGSTDGTVDIIQRYHSHLSYWHSRKDRGISHAFNLGLAQTRGNWVLFLNADDFLLDPLRLETMAKYLQTHCGADVVYGQRYLMSRDRDPLLVRKARGRPWKWQEFRRRQTIPHPASFTSRSFFNRVEGFDEAFHIAMDYDLFLRERQNLKAQYIPLPITGMRDGGCCKQSIIKTWMEGRRAQENNRALSPSLSWLNFFWQIGRHYCLHSLLKLLRIFPKRLSCEG
jgi:glycosyltransferase involved in cell wall biosynthesis